MKKSVELEIAIKATREAGKILLEKRNSHRIVKQKDNVDVATDADIESEKVIIEIIKKAFPVHSIVSEEAGLAKKGREFCWFVDPLDGSKNFVRDIPIFSVSIALANEKELIAGAVFDPSTNRLYFAEKGKGAFLGDNRISVSKTANLEDSLAYVDSPQRKIYYTSKNFYRTRDFGVGSLALCYLAQGGFDVYIQDTLKLMDHGAGLLIAKEAGARVTDLRGKEISLESKDLVAANPVLHKKVLALVK